MSLKEKNNPFITVINVINDILFLDLATPNKTQSCCVLFTFALFIMIIVIHKHVPKDGHSGHLFDLISCEHSCLLHSSDIIGLPLATVASYTIEYLESGHNSGMRQS